jgi:hypothetical protein
MGTSALLGAHQLPVRGGEGLDGEEAATRRRRIRGHGVDDGAQCRQVRQVHQVGVHAEVVRARRAEGRRQRGERRAQRGWRVRAAPDLEM